MLPGRIPRQTVPIGRANAPLPDFRRVCLFSFLLCGGLSLFHSRAPPLIKGLSFCCLSKTFPTHKDKEASKFLCDNAIRSVLMRFEMVIFWDDQRNNRPEFALKISFALHHGIVLPQHEKKERKNLFFPFYPHSGELYIYLYITKHSFLERHALISPSSSLE